MTKFFLAIVMLSAVLSSKAQLNTLSPYSIYGIGDSPYSSLSSMASLSHTGIAMLSTININTVNPAALTYVSRPTFNFDFRNEFLILNTTGQSQNNHLFSIENISLAFPIINSSKRRRKAAFSFGVTPYSRQGYEVVSMETVPELGDVEYRFVGEGGINNAFLTGSLDLIADSGRVNVLSMGVTGSYVFGTLSRNRITTVDSTASASNLYRESQNEISAVDVKIGLLYTRKLVFNKTEGDEVFGSVSVGGFFKPSVKLGGSSTQTAYTFANRFENAQIIDTLKTGSSTNPILAPASFGIGIGFTYDNRWNLGLDITSYQWSQLEIDGVNTGLNNALRASLGIEFTPDPTSYKQILNIIRYRTGFSFEQSRLNVNGVQPNQIGVSAGFGIPVIATRSTTMFNIGTEYVLRGATGLPVSENFFNVYLGFSVTPNQYDRWFAKRKYD